MTICRTLSLALGRNGDGETVPYSNGRTRYEVGLANARPGNRDGVLDCPTPRSPRAEVRWSLERDAPRQACQHVDPRRGDLLRHRADDGGLQQSRSIRSARSAEQ